jgi:hypothetical protein
MIFPLLKFAPRTAILDEEFTKDGVTIPKGHVFNGNSVPRIFYSFTGGRYEPKYVVPALVHDHMYYTKRPSRKEADAIYLKNLRHNGCFCAPVFYVCVRLFGWVRYNK